MKRMIRANSTENSTADLMDIIDSINAEMGMTHEDFLKSFIRNLGYDKSLDLIKKFADSYNISFILDEYL